ncbi:hypothetical protein [Plantactinospora sp. KBS50]|uniref:hypothetical protein n=1 Tax=Plantactinospora sp. KBS50 TaxID=2024580 RepID=UPI0012FDD014|nr:hypothetical protein [Plantactinospora sp. KBS50]
MSDAPALKVASLPPPSPKMLNSAVVQPAAAFTAFEPAVVYAVDPTSRVTLSAPGTALPESRSEPRLEIGWLGTATPVGLFR